MPFKSEAERELAHATSKQPGRGFTKKQAKEWEKKTPKGKKLPEKVSKKKGAKRGRS